MKTAQLIKLWRSEYMAPLLFCLILVIAFVAWKRFVRPTICQKPPIAANNQTATESFADRWARSFMDSAETRSVNETASGADHIAHPEMDQLEEASGMELSIDGATKEFLATREGRGTARARKWGSSRPTEKFAVADEESLDGRGVRTGAFRNKPTGHLTNALFKN